VTRLWYKPASDIQLPPIPERPTEKDAQSALKDLEDLLVEFPFNNSISKSVAIAAMMTPVLRGAFDVAPLFFLVAPDTGTGKTYLVIVISTIATGRAAVGIASIDNREEMEKRLSVAAMEASPILFMNNLSFNLESDMLCQMVSEGAVKPRILGKSEMPECDCRGMTVFANGNNIRLVGDLVRRAVTARLDAKKEEPEKRTFKHNPVNMVLANRGKYLAAIFTIARAHAVDGQPTPKNAEPLAGFEAWSRMVRHPLIWLGLKDPVEHGGSTSPGPTAHCPG
jgi:putative DNA primase/helicase